MPVARLRAPVAAIVAAAFALLAAFVAVPAAATGVTTERLASGNGSTCATGTENDGSEWRKLDGLSGTTYTAEAREGYLIVETCVKAANEDPRYQDVEPAAEEVELVSHATNKKGKTQDVSHVSVREIPYAAPTCEGFTYDFGESVGGMHVNVEVTKLDEDVTRHFNWHDDGGELEGELTLDPREHADWPEEWDDAQVAITWIQVHGYNFHWKGSVPLDCDDEPVPTPTLTPTPGDDPEPSPIPSDEPGSDPSPLPSEAPEGSLDGSIAVGECLEDAPWIRYDVQVKPVDTSLEDRTVELVLTDGTNTETITLGELGEDGTLSGRTLWPGASVADDGVTPTGWPGWTQLDDGTWAETDGNDGWTRGDIEATLVANPELAVDLAYPEATPECDAAPTQVVPADGSGEGDPVRAQQTLVDPALTADAADAGDALDPGDDPLPQTGSNVTLIALGALALVAAGGAFLWLRRRA